MSVKFLSAILGRRWLRQFHGRLEFCFLSVGNLHVHQIPCFRGGGVFWVFGGEGGGADFIFMGAGISLTNNSTTLDKNLAPMGTENQSSTGGWGLEEGSS